MVVDTNIVSAFLRPDAEKRTPKLCAFVAAQTVAEGLAVSYVTQFELRRGMEELLLRGKGRRKAVVFEKFIDRVLVLGLDAASGEGWNLAAQLWAEGRTRKPARVFTDADLLNAATAAFHRHEFATSDVGQPLPSGLRRIAVERIGETAHAFQQRRDLGADIDALAVGEVFESVAASEIRADEDTGGSLTIATGSEQADAGAETNLMTPVAHMRHRRPRLFGLEDDASRRSSRQREDEEQALAERPSDVVVHDHGQSQVG